MTEEEKLKKIILDFSDVNPADHESVRRYGERCTLAGDIYYGMKRAEKEVERLKEKIKLLGDRK